MNNINTRRPLHGRVIKAGITLSTIATLFTLVPSALADTPQQGLTSTQGTTSQQTAPEEFKVNSKAGYVIDMNTNQVLYSHNADTPMPIASLTKTLTLYLTEKAISKGKLTWDTPVKVSAPLHKMSTDSVLGSYHMHQGTTYTVRDLFHAALIASSNSAAIALGEAVGGSNANFIKMMNDQMSSWGLDEAKFVSSSGLDNTDLAPYNYVLDGTTAKEENLVSAKDIAEVGRHLIKEYPDVLKVSAIEEETLHNEKLITSNEDLPNKKDYDSTLGIDGLKTGYTENAGLCFIATDEIYKGHRLISVVLNSPNSFTATNAMLHHVYRTLKPYTYAPEKHMDAFNKGELSSVQVTPDMGATKTGKMSIWANKSAYKIDATTKYTKTADQLAEGDSTVVGKETVVEPITKAKYTFNLVAYDVQKKAVSRKASLNAKPDNNAKRAVGTEDTLHSNEKSSSITKGLAKIGKKIVKWFESLL